MTPDESYIKELTLNSHVYRVRLVLIRILKNSSPYRTGSLHSLVAKESSVHNAKITDKKQDIKNIIIFKTRRTDNSTL